MGRATRRNRKTRSVLLLAVFLLALFTNMARPRPAHAQNLGLIIGIGVGIFVVVIVAGTWLVYGRQYERKQAFLPDEPPPPGVREGVEGVRFAPHCQPTDGQPPLLCW